MAIIKTETLNLDFNKGFRTNVEIVNGRVQLEVVGTSLVPYKESNIPKMTSNTTPSGTATASAAYYPAWHAFDRNDITYWRGDTTPPVGGHWIKYDFGSNVVKQIEKIAITANTSSGTDVGIKTFNLSGSNDDINFNMIYSDVHPNSTERVEYNFINLNKYKIYKLTVLDSYDNRGYTSIKEIEMREYKNEYFYSPSGTIEFPSIDLGSHFKQINSISAIKNIPEATSLKIFTSTSRNNITYSDFSLLNNDTGLITSPQGRYIKIKVEFLGDTKIIDKVINDFFVGEESQFQHNDLIMFDGSLRLKINYSNEMIRDISWSEEGKLFRKPLNKTKLKKINTIRVRIDE
ncbi:discoidin domain-containing protein [Paenibacillus sp. N1-5-1-14]|uniref:discoidin domain-containing protein n=1 Tax=Paenibacillus radicibacter TaxID=2972488 RepID=UPI002159354E|nr:discoidin domain-containing protein [Paenibacillus radicibacter]MCR8641564.1 discoidin domain-containing protein [Paenibacillus radicibacter]